MGFRNVYDNDWSENGWRMCNRDECDIVRIPGLYLTETAPLRRGAPLTILGAWLYWYDRNVEEITEEIWGWSLENAVGDSNHLAGTAVDVNDSKYPWGSRTMPADRIAKVRAGLGLFEGSVYWGADWNRADEMHYQMAWPEGDPRNEAFAQKLLNGYLGIYKQGTPALSKMDQYALATINEGKRLGISPKGICIALAVELVETNLTMYANRNVPGSELLPHDKVGSDHDSTGLFQQRQAWGPLSSTMDPTLSARLFFLGGQAGQRGLTDFDYNSNSRTPGGWAQAVQVSAFPDRYDGRYAEAQEIYNRLANYPGEDDFLSALNPDEQRELLELSRQQAKYRRQSLSPLRWPGESDVNTCAGFAWSADGNVHVVLVERLAVEYGDTVAIALLIAVEHTSQDQVKYPERQQDAKLARRILDKVTPENLADAQAQIKEWLDAEAAQKAAA